MLEEYSEEEHKIYFATLKWINKIRRQQGKSRIRKIRRGTLFAMSCPIANSLKDCFPESQVYVTSMVYVDNGINVVKIDYPREVGLFIGRFDRKEAYQNLREN